MVCCLMASLSTETSTKVSLAKFNIEVNCSSLIIVDRLRTLGEKHAKQVRVNRNTFKNSKPHVRTMIQHRMEVPFFCVVVVPGVLLVDLVG